MEKDRSRMVELNELLKKASRAYYQQSREIMSNYDYDALYDELVDLEKKTGIILSDSVTQNVGYEVLSQLEKVEHDKPMLSLDKTKSVEALQEWMGNQSAILSWKLDGLTIVLTYEGGELKQAVTRGNGFIGEDVTNNVRRFKNIPLRIPYTGKLVIRGEAVIKYSDFEKFSGEYKNPRNLCSGSVRQLDPSVTENRNVNLFVFSLVSADVDFKNSNTKKFEWLKNQGFEVVEYVIADRNTLPDKVAEFAKKIETYDVPSDGLVLLLEDIAYGESLGTTAKFPRNAIAFKWKDETAETTLKYVEWSPSRTGLINPVAVFEPVEIEGTTVSRASLHNISIMEGLEIGSGDTITVYKANMIIPQIAENMTRSGVRDIPEVCPVCGYPTEIKSENDVKTLYCINPGCPVKRIKSFALLASRDAMNIDGLSEMTLEKLIAAGFIRKPADIFRLERYRKEIAGLEGFGEKSADNLIKAADAASETTLPRLIYSLGIPGIGVANAKMISKYFNGDFDRIRQASVEELCGIEGIGDVLAGSIYEFFNDRNNNENIDELLQSVKIIQTGAESETVQNMEGLTFVITGSLTGFGNRKELQQLIEDHGGKTASAVSGSTDYLINNDTASSSSKNKKAKELGIPVISEKEFMEHFVF
ncbi:MAG: NAD-dependent DNA ligase LigA [Lachnospiraceae bacterium]|nr:NAD-dependent DNA ligase LigA [Candidatus Darwinimomas equi]